MHVFSCLSESLDTARRRGGRVNLKNSTFGIALALCTIAIKLGHAGIVHLSHTQTISVPPQSNLSIPVYKDIFFFNQQKHHQEIKKIYMSKCINS